MAKKKLGTKYVCYQCDCKFYDLGRPKPICPKCGADQSEAPKRERHAPAKAGFTSAPPPRPRGRRRRTEEDSIEPGEAFPEDEIEPASPLEDGLTMIDDEELLGAAEDFPEED